MEKTKQDNMQNQNPQTVPPHIDAIFKEYIGSRNIAIADLQVYIRAPVGVGEHSDIGDMVKQKLQEIDKFDSMLQTIMNLYPALNEPEDGEEDQGAGSSQSEPNQPSRGEKTDLYEDGKILSKFKTQNSD